MNEYSYHVRDQFLVLLEIVLLEILYCLLDIRFIVNKLTLSSNSHRLVTVENNISELCV